MSILVYYVILAKLVRPRKSGSEDPDFSLAAFLWIPAFAGMTRFL